MKRNILFSAFLLSLSTVSDSAGNQSLTNCTPVTGISAALHAWQDYTIDIPANADSLTVRTSGGTGDGDLYVKFNHTARITSFDCRSYAVGNQETCTFNPPSAGQYYIGIYPYSAVTGMTLEACYTTGGNANQAPAVNAGTDQTITLPADTVNLDGTVTDDGLPNPPDAVSTTWSKISGPGTVTFGNTGSADTTATFSAAGIYVLHLTATDGERSVLDEITVTVSSSTGNNALTNCTPITGITAARHAWQYYTLLVPMNAESLTVKTSSGTGDADLYVQFNTSPTISSFDCRSFVVGNRETCTLTFNTPSGGDYRIGIYPYTAIAGVTLEACYTRGNTNEPPSVYAGRDQISAMPNNSLFLNGRVEDDALPNPPGTVSISWSKVSGPGSVTFSTPNSPDTTATFSAAGTYQLRLTGDDGELSASDDVTITVNDTRIAEPLNNCDIISGLSGSSGSWKYYFIDVPDGAERLSVSTRSVDGGDISGADLYVKFGGLPPGSSDCISSMWFDNEGCGISSPAPGRYYIGIRGDGSYAGVMLTARYTACDWGDNEAPSVNAGPDRTITLPTDTLTLEGIVTDDGLPDPPGTVMTAWGNTRGDSWVTFSDKRNTVTDATFPGAGTYVLQLAADDGRLRAADRVTVTVNAGTGNEPPAVNAGADQTVTLPDDTVNLNGTVTDDGLPNPPGAVSVSWSKISGPGTVSFNNPNSTDTTATFSAAGTYQLRLTADDGELSAFDDITVTVGSSTGNNTLTNCTPVTGISAALHTWQDYTIDVPAGADRLTVRTSGGTGDGDLYVKFNRTARVTSFDCRSALVGNQDTCIFSTPSAGRYHIGIYPYSAVTGMTLEACYSTDGSSNQPPVVNAGADLKVTLSDDIIHLDGTVTDDGLPNPPGAVSTLWEKFTGPGTVTFGDTNSIDTTVTFSAEGTYVLRLTADDGELRASDDISVRVTSAVDELTNCIPVTGISGAWHTWRRYLIDVPAGVERLVVSIRGNGYGINGADLYVSKFEAHPDPSEKCESSMWFDNESCAIRTPSAGRYLVRIYADSSYSDLTLTARYTASCD